MIVFWGVVIRSTKHFEFFLRVWAVKEKKKTLKKICKKDLSEMHRVVTLLQHRQSITSCKVFSR
jgi:hypothetical protein